MTPAAGRGETATGDSVAEGGRSVKDWVEFFSNDFGVASTFPSFHPYPPFNCGFPALPDVSFSREMSERGLDS